MKLAKQVVIANFVIRAKENIGLKKMLMIFLNRYFIITSELSQFQMLDLY